MSHCLRLLLVLILFVKQEVDVALLVRKFVYQKDMSEYCRRRVMPSVFLGRQVIDAYSQILHFSRLELPYSCFVSVRTESGSNIILVIQLMSDNSLIESCRNSKNQLLVYEIGETFGGYWGPLPDSMVKVPVTTEESQLYTLKTTQPTTTTTTTIRTITRRTKPSTTENSENATRESAQRVDEIIVEVPLVNVSAILVPGVLPSGSRFEDEESFDTVIDVKPRPGISYKTKILPLVQFKLSDQVSGLRTSGEEDEIGQRIGGEEVETGQRIGGEEDVIGQRTSGEDDVSRQHSDDSDVAVTPRYEIDLNADFFTPDARLSYPLLRLTTRSKQRGKYRYNVNSRLDFKKNRLFFAEKQALFHKTSEMPHKLASFDLQPSDVMPSQYFTEPSSQKETEHPSNPYEIVDAILKNLSKKKDEVPKINLTLDKDVRDLLQGLAKIGYNESVFLVPNASWYTRRVPSTARRISNKYRTDSITWRQPSASYKTNYFEEDDTIEEGSSQDASESPDSIKATNNNDAVIIDVVKSGPLLPPALDVDRVLLNVTQQIGEIKKSTLLVNPETLASEVSGTTTTAATPETAKPMTLVDHESWENMVQAASLMAVVLNQSITSSVGEEQGLNVTLLPLTDVKRRKKRYMHAIPIEFAKPHHLPVTVNVPTTTVHTGQMISDTQEFQRLIELQDDEIHDRIALRYLRQYVGPALFNICDFDEAAAGHTFLFNSSRLVLAINNFTLERMTVVMTPARTLLSSDSRCAHSHLECQVSGARVCIDSLCACDGVPNCGKYDIYDEDHLTCGGSAGLQHNVCLAAITFLAVLLTILYTVHYWLKRCVPKVSDAFFIYTDAAENILYLDPIMRSPHDTDDPKDMYRCAAMPDYMECTDMRIQTKKTVSSFISRLAKFFRCKRQKKGSHTLNDQIIDGDYEGMDVGNRRFFSFAEVELGKMGTPHLIDAEVQTGSSLDTIMNKLSIEERMIKVDSGSEDIVTHYEGRESEDIVAHYEGRESSIHRRSLLGLGEMVVKETSDELSILNFFRRARSVSMQMSPIALNYTEVQAAPTNTDEKEIQCYEFDHSNISQVVENVSIREISSIKAEGPVKKLRFEEEATIHVSDDEVEEETGASPEQHRRRSVVYGGGKSSHLDESDSNSNADEPSTSTGNREFKSYFWGSGKGKSKKTTKKKSQQMNLR